LEIIKGILSTGAIDDFDMKKASKGSPPFGYISSRNKDKEDLEKIFTTRKISLKDDSISEGLESKALNYFFSLVFKFVYFIHFYIWLIILEHFNPSARKSIESLQSSQKLTASTIYLRRVVKTVLFFFKLQISYPFLSLTVFWNTLTENKDKVTSIVNKEAQKIFSNLNLQTLIYDYHITYFKEIFSQSSSQAITNLDLPLMFMHFATYFDQVYLV